MADGYVTIQTKMDTSMIDKQIGLLEDKLEGLEEEYEILEKAKPFEGQQEQLIKLGNEIDRTKKKVARLREEKEKMTKVDFSGLTSSVENIGNGIEKAIKKVARWGLAIFGIRSAYLAVRQAMGTISQYDNQMKANVDYIRFVLANTLKPVIEWIINGVYKILYYVNYIAQAWFGINLFANSSAKAFASANNNAQKLKNTLAGFDEMNILSDQETQGVAMPSFDLSKMGDIEIPDWVKWIAENKDTILTVASIIAGLFGASVVAGWISNLTTFMGAKGLGLLATKLGTLATLAGSVIITALVAKKVWEEAEELKKEIKKIREEGSKAQNEWIENEEDLNTLITTGNVNRTAGYELLKKSGGVWNWINGLGLENLETAKQTAINIGKQIDKEVELYKQGKLNEEQQEQVKQNIIDQIKYNNEVIQKLKENGKETSQIETLNQKLIQNYKDMGGNVEKVDDSLNKINQYKFDNKTVNVTINGNTETLMQKIRRLNDQLEKARDYAKQLAGGLGFSSSGGGGGSIGGGSSGGYRAKGGIYHPSLLPKLAVGGIINNPGMGVPYHGAIIGERGAEAVVPLTDSQQMALLGETIGRYVNIELTSILEADGRTLARVVNKANSENDFLMNR